MTIKLSSIVKELLTKLFPSPKSTVHERGKKGCTKYFLIPKCLRKNIKLKKEASCLRIVCKDKIIWAYVMDKI